MTTKSSNQEIVQSILFMTRILVASVFLISGFSKLIRPLVYFEVAIGQFNVGPFWLTSVVAHIFPWIELIFGGYLLLGFLTKYSSGILLILCVIFQFVLGQAILRGLPVDQCGCFGGDIAHLTLYQSFTLDTVLALLLTQVLTRPQHAVSLDRFFERSAA